MADTIRWGIAGTGRIAHTVAQDFPHVPGAELVAVGSRSQEHADAFAAQFPGVRAHGSYRTLLDDPDIDVIYIATPHPQHRDLAVAAHEAGKATLVEKAFTATVAGAEAVLESAKQNNVFCMEAMWTRFLPSVAKVRRNVEQGCLGDIRQVQADLGAYRPYDPTDRLFDPELGGGAMLDLGVYLVSFAQCFLGTPTRVEVTGELYPNGVESAFSMLLGFENGGSATLMGSLNASSPGRAVLVGQKGYLEVGPRFHHPTDLGLYRHGHVPELCKLEMFGRGYAHELREVTECLRDGKVESEVMPHADTLAVMRVLEEALQQLGVQQQDQPVELG